MIAGMMDPGLLGYEGAVHGHMDAPGGHGH
jgi:hypothetical protein